MWPGPVQQVVPSLNQKIYSQDQWARRWHRDRSMRVEPRDTERKNSVILTYSSMNIQVLFGGQPHTQCWPRLLLHFKNYLKFSFHFNEKKSFRLIIQYLVHNWCSVSGDHGPSLPGSCDVLCNVPQRHSAPSQKQSPLHREKWPIPAANTRTALFQSLLFPKPHRLMERKAGPLGSLLWKENDFQPNFVS